MLQVAEDAYRLVQRHGAAPDNLRPRALADLDHLARLQHADRSAHGLTRDFERRRQLALGRQLVARLQQSRVDHVGELVADLILHGPLADRTAVARNAFDELEVSRHSWPTGPGSIPVEGGASTERILLLGRNCVLDVSRWGRNACPGTGSSISWPRCGRNASKTTCPSGA